MREVPEFYNFYILQRGGYLTEEGSKRFFTLEDMYEFVVEKGVGQEEVYDMYCSSNEGGIDFLSGRIKDVMELYKKLRIV